MTDLLTNPISLWLISGVLLGVRFLRGKHVGIGLAYWSVLAAMHLLGTVLVMIYRAPGEDVRAIWEGFTQAGRAIAAFTVGWLVVEWTVSSTAPKRRPTTTRVSAVRASHLVVLGIAFSIAVRSPLAEIPSLRAFLSTGLALVTAGICLASWNAWNQGRRGMLAWALVGVLLLPVLSTLTDGFMSTGLGGSIICLAFVAGFYRPRWHLPVLGLLVVFFALSVYVTYMRDRQELRHVVWGGAPIGQRWDRYAKTLETLELFDPTDPLHRMRVVSRMDQNVLLGLAVQRLEQKFVEYAEGETLKDALLAIVPRILWQDKPIMAGSGDHVARYTGLRFAQGTSVGMGQVFELYVNFGNMGVIVGMLLLGGVMSFLDARATRALLQGRTGSFLQWYLPAISLLQPGGSAVEITGNLAATAILGLLISRVFVQRHVMSTTPSPDTAVA